MKVVLFCGGQGMRIREYSDKVPKPMVPIGYRPVLWHVMKYYAHFGHKDFILCLGHQADVIKDYFVNYHEYVSNDFVLSKGANMNLLNKDIDDWNITFAFTGVSSNIGERLLAAKRYLGDDEMFLANYSDGLTNLPLNDIIEKFRNTDKVGSFMAAKPTRSFHVAVIDETNNVQSMSSLSEMKGTWVNAGYFVFRKEIFDYIRPGEELVEEPFQRLIKEKKLMAHPYEGTFLTMDTFKEKQALDDMYAKGDTPWQVWKTADDPTKRTA
jgi:glucose-1-phosphate cytidylyltransferase